MRPVRDNLNLKLLVYYEINEDYKGLHIADVLFGHILSLMR